jgi:hypothetical protein
MDRSPPERTGQSIEVDELDSKILDQQRERFRLRCMVNSHFLARTSQALHECYKEENVSHVRGECQALLRYCMGRDDSEQFPLWHVVGNHLALIAKKRKVSGPKEVHAVCERYIRRDDLHGSLKDEHIHQEAVDYEINLLAKKGADRPFAPRYDHVRGLEFAGSGLMQLELLTVAKEADLFRAIGFAQSVFLDRIRQCILESPQASESDRLESAQTLRKELSHISIYSPHLDEKPKLVSVPVLSGCEYFELDRAKDEPYPSFDAFLAVTKPHSPQDYLKALDEKARKRVLNAAKVYFDRGGSDHPRIRTEVIFNTETK